jgi:hypothetical protein
MESIARFISMTLNTHLDSSTLGKGIAVDSRPCGNNNLRGIVHSSSFPRSRESTVTMPLRLISQAVLLVVILLLLPLLSSAQPPVIQIQQDFSRDPGWIGFQNRMKCVDCPEVVQDFGWIPPNPASSSPGRIGGRICNSRYQAYYAMPLGKSLSFKDSFSASGKLAVTGLGLRGVGYFGFFNEARHEWRIWSSMAIRIWEEDMLGQIMVDWMSGTWMAGGFDTDIFVPVDGTTLTWSLEYDPDGVIETVWKYPKIKDYMTTQAGNASGLLDLQKEENLFALAKNDESSLTPEEFRKRLEELRDQGVVEYFQRHDIHRWWANAHPEEYQGKITFQVGDRRPYVVFIRKEVRDTPTEMNRFGLFNIQRYGESIEMYLLDLVINGVEMDLSQDPHWEGRNNHASWVEPNFQSMNDFGYAQTNWAGKAPGEIGGLFWRVESTDPHIGYYADDTGPLTLEDPISFSGRINFITGMTDAAMYFGYFNSKDYTPSEVIDPAKGNPSPERLGLCIADSSAVGYYFDGLVSNSTGGGSELRGPVFVPDQKPRDFSFIYDPAANKGVGQIRFTLDGQETVLDLDPSVRQSGAKFDRFGFASVRSGGNSVEVYLDDLTYSVRRDPDTKPDIHPQETLPVRYPKESAGRKY